MVKQPRMLTLGALTVNSIAEPHALIRGLPEVSRCFCVKQGGTTPLQELAGKNACFLAWTESLWVSSVRKRLPPSANQRETCCVHTWGKNSSAHFFLIILWTVHLLKLPVRETVNASVFLTVVAHWVWGWVGKGVVLANGLLVSNKLFSTQVWIQIAGNDNGDGFLSLFMLGRHGVCFSGIHLSAISLE